MKSLHQVDNKIKVPVGVLLAFGLGALLPAWLLGQLAAIGELGVQAGRAGANAAAATERMHALVGDLQLWAGIGLVFGMGAAIMLGLWLSAEVARPLKEAARIARSIAEGNLGVAIAAEEGGDAGELLRQMQAANDRLLAMMRDLRAATGLLVKGTADIASGSMDLSARTEQQASSLEETASSMEELTATVKQNADHAFEASKLAVSASEVAVKGGEVVSQVVGTMASINESSKRIAEIIGVIDGIAFQTNILALNAAVEAARAGEQGRGFAVVASEVRNLAQRSAAAAKEIKELIDDSVEKVNAGTELADKAGSTMNEVVSSVKRVTGIIGEIADASAEQTSGIDQVNSAITAMDQATQQNAALVEQSAAAASSMREQADSLTKLIGSFSRERQPQKQERAVQPAARNANANARAKPAPRATAQKPVPAPRGPLRPAPAATAARPAAAQRARGGALPAIVDDWEEF
jgi:methyl-accepting chemotaxis protein